MASSPRRKKIECSDSTLELLQQLADFHGHGDVKAALATLAKFGVPLMLGAPMTASATTTTTEAAKAPETTDEAQDRFSRLGFKHIKIENAEFVARKALECKNSALVDSVLANGSQAGFREGGKGSWTAPSDDCVAALVNRIEEF